MKMKDVRKLKKEGYSKQEVFDKASEGGAKPKKVAAFLSTIPDPDDAERYNTINNILVALYAVIIAITVLGGAASLSLSPTALIVLIVLAALLHGSILYGVKQKKASYYSIICTFMFLNCLAGLTDFNSISVLAVISIAIPVSVIILAVYVKKKMFPFQGYYHNKKDKNGFKVFTKESESNVAETSYEAT